MLCWHQLRIRGRFKVCRHCGIGIEQCPCVAFDRVPKGDCILCFGSGWIAVIRSEAMRFREFAGLDADVE